MNEMRREKEHAEPWNSLLGSHPAGVVVLPHLASASLPFLPPSALTVEEEEDPDEDEDDNGDGDGNEGHHPVGCWEWMTYAC
ncbi:GM19623 [Drosophila sechellia]|uniref:GM19623 n=1 Tax=Drosophila sechellia TaxID=7238 RepID=B4INA6_DROSE|nr:GM19623 [Drosophila sechellia]